MNSIRENWNPKKTRYLTYLLAIIVFSVIGIIYAFIYFSDLILLTLQSIEGSLVVMMILLIRIIIMSILTYFIFRNWFKAEEVFLNDIPCLIGIMFMIITLGKALDLLQNLTFLTLPDDQAIVFLKIRFIPIIFVAVPLLYLGINMIFYNLSLKGKDKYKDENLVKKRRNLILVGIIVVELIVLLTASNITFIGILLPIFIIPSLIIATWLFYFAWKNDRLSSVNPFLLMIGFGLYFISNILRPLLQGLLGTNVLYAVIVETFDIAVFIIIFIGLLSQK